MLEEDLLHKNHEEAFKIINTRLQNEPDNPSLYVTLGIIYRKKSLFSQAQTTFQKALQINPKHIEARAHLCLLLSDLGHYEEAKAHFPLRSEKASSQEFSYNLAAKHLELAECYCKQMDFSLALQELRKAELQSSVSPHLKILICKIKLKIPGEEERAILDLHNLLETTVAHEAYLYLAIIALQKYDRKAALQSLTKALALDKKDVRSLALFSYLTEK